MHNPPHLQQPGGYTPDPYGGQYAPHGGYAPGPHGGQYGPQGGYAPDPYGGQYAPHGGYGAPPVYGPPNAHLGIRLAARLIDGVLSTLLFFAVLLAGVGSAAGVDALILDSHDISPFAAVLIVVGVVGAFAAMVCYWTLPVAKSGKTVGKRLLGIKIVAMATGEPPSKGRAFGRYGFEVALAFVPFATYVNILWPLWDKPYQHALHDKVAGTHVIQG